MSLQKHILLLRTSTLKFQGNQTKTDKIVPVFCKAFCKSTQESTEGISQLPSSTLYRIENLIFRDGKLMMLTCMKEWENKQAPDMMTTLFPAGYNYLLYCLSGFFQSLREIVSGSNQCNRHTPPSKILFRAASFCQLLPLLQGQLLWEKRYLLSFSETTWTYRI